MLRYGFCFPYAGIETIFGDVKPAVSFYLFLVGALKVDVLVKLIVV